MRGRDRPKAVTGMLGHVREIEREIVRAGGAVSDLRVQLATARGFLEGDAHARKRRGGIGVGGTAWRDRV